MKGHAAFEGTYVIDGYGINYGVNGVPPFYRATMGARGGGRSNPVLSMQVVLGPETQTRFILEPGPKRGLQSVLLYDQDGELIFISEGRLDLLRRFEVTIYPRDDDSFVVADASPLLLDIALLEQGVSVTGQVRVAHLPEHDSIGSEIP